MPTLRVLDLTKTSDILLYHSVMRLDTHCVFVSPIHADFHTPGQAGLLA